MSRSQLTSRTVYAELDAHEHDAFDEIMRATGQTSDANTVRAALWHFARHLGLDLPLHTFALRTTRGMTAAPKPKSKPRISQANHQPVSTPEPRVIKRSSRPQPQSHPWRQSVGSKEVS